MNEQHPSLETLLDLTLDELPEGTAASVREHLLDCGECRERVRKLLEEPDEPPPGMAAVGPQARDEAWERFRERLAAGGSAPPRESHESGPLPFRPPERQSRLPTGSGAVMAAAGAVLAFGLGYLVAPDNPELPPNMPAAETLVEGDGTFVRGPTGSSTPAECPSPDHALIWKLSLTHPPPPEVEMRLEVRRPDGDTEKPLAMSANAAGQLLLNRRPRATPPGLYVVEVRTPEGAGLETFRISVECGDG
ncbi:MAG: hypothetical protein MI919_10995 [Holophagales bacterium]|nr:hypothetical protein [Holophagales bacterium]